MHRSKRMCKRHLATHFEGAVALVTGASAGIGEAIARQLAVDHGMKVVGCARRITRLQTMEKDFEGLIFIEALIDFAGSFLNYVIII